ncbi:MAG: hypothetical protein CVU86_01535 [Firmicutes bacterium HGW-Firmicutes-11]|nr:MAG: hypothetical protein CVU86_01535 [Firmicutes bacterium HGW-Firmicutes-11]
MAWDLHVFKMKYYVDFKHMVYTINFNLWMQRSIWNVAEVRQDKVSFVAKCFQVKMIEEDRE